MDSLVILLPLIPLLAAITIGVCKLFGLFNLEKQALITAVLSQGGLSITTLLAISLSIAEYLNQTVGSYTAGTWINSDLLTITVSFFTGGNTLKATVFSSVMLLIIACYSIKQLQREAGFQRCLFVLNLFAAALFLSLLSGNMLMTFIGWQLINVCGYFLILYGYQDPLTAYNGTRVFMSNRIGDGGFLMGIGLSYSWLGSVNWTDFIQGISDLRLTELTLLILCFATAAFAKSAQLPFSPWLSRSMEGPVASSAVLFSALIVHSGVFLVISLQVVFEQSVIAMSALVIIGGLTALYGSFVGLTQTDIKSSLNFAIISQLGLMFVECGLGFWTFCCWHIVVHSVLRTYQLLNASSFMQQAQGLTSGQLPQQLLKSRWGFEVSLQRFWLDPLTDWTLVNPTLQLGKDLSYFDDHIVNAVMGAPAPAMNALATLAQLEEQQAIGLLDDETDTFAKGTGVAGKIAETTAAILQWLEERIVLKGMHDDALKFGRQLGIAANHIEHLLIRPRYLTLCVFITLLAVF